ncbi:MAG TPA: ATP-binding cassette domain-containing protein [Solirubrobacterales bacterium]
MDRSSGLVALRGVGKRYALGGPWVLDGIDLALGRGRVARASGPNGSGKSTLLRLLAGASMPTRGARTTAAGLGVGYAPDGLGRPRSMPVRSYLRHQLRVRAARGADAVAMGTEVATNIERFDACTWPPRSCRRSPRARSRRSS